MRAILIYPGLLLIVFNGLASYYFGEVATEGAAIIFTLLFLSFLIFNSQLILSYRLLFALCSISFLIIAGAAEIFFSDQFYRFVFLYQYILIFLFIILLSSEIKINIFFITGISRFLALLAVITVLISIFQRLDMFSMLPLENHIRSTGLSRTSLNLSGILLSLLFILSICLRDGIEKYFYYAIILIGLVFAGGRGALVSFFLYLILFYRCNLFNFSILKSFNFLLSIPLMILIYHFFDSEDLNRFISVFNFYTEQSNLDRLDSYFLYLNYFNFFGAGIGLTSPGAGRFGDFIGFESFILNTAYEVGLFGLILISSSFLFLLINSKNRENYVVFIIGIFPVLAGQQLHASPTVFSFMIIAFSLVFIKTKNTHSVYAL